MLSALNADWCEIDYSFIWHARELAISIASERLEKWTYRSERRRNAEQNNLARRRSRSREGLSSDSVQTPQNNKITPHLLSLPLQHIFNTQKHKVYYIHTYFSIDPQRKLHTYPVSSLKGSSPGNPGKALTIVCEEVGFGIYDTTTITSKTLEMNFVWFVMLVFSDWQKEYKDKSIVRY